MKSIITFLIIFLTVTGMSQQNIKLPPPQKEIGKPLMQALNLRESTREFTSDSISIQDLSNLLWAGWGINRPETGKRTAPSSRNVQDIDIYVFLPAGVYTYDAPGHQLLLILKEDARHLTGTQDFVKSAPLNLVFISDQSKMSNYTPENKLITGSANAAFIAQNIYLYCASQNLGVVVRAMIDRDALSSKLKLRPDQRIFLAQTIGHKK